MKRILSTLISLMLVLAVHSQVVQQGIVQEYKGKASKTPLAGVELNVRSAGSAVSDKSGSFSLNFNTLKAGERVNVRRIEKDGYEIFNKEALEQWNINPSRPFVVVMCRSDKLRKLKDNYHRISSASYARQLKRRRMPLPRLKGTES